MPFVREQSGGTPDNLFIIHSSTDRVVAYYVEDNEGHFNVRVNTGTSNKPSYVDNITVNSWNRYSVTLLPGTYMIAQNVNGGMVVDWEEVTYSTPTTLSQSGTHNFIILYKIG